MKLVYVNYLALSLVISGCASVYKPLDDKQVSLINKKPKIVKKLPTNYKEPLFVYQRSESAGVAVGSVVFGLLTGSLGFHSDGITPRTRLENHSPADVIKNSARKAAAEKINRFNPSKAIEKLLLTRFPQSISSNTEPPKDQLTISVTPIVWHLYYGEFFKDKETYVLEYAVDILLSMQDEKIKRLIQCDQQSDVELTKEDWFAYDAKRIKMFIDATSKKCANLVLKELKQPIISESMSTETQEKAPSISITKSASVTDKKK